MRWLIVALIVALAGCPGATPKRETTVEETQAQKKKKKKKKKKVAKKDLTPGEIQHGRAVWYGGKHHGGQTASGERFNKRAMTAAHRDLPMGTKVRVTNQRNGRSVVVRINDRGPFGKDKRRVIDLSEAAARKLDYIDAGWTEVTIEVLEMPEKKPKKK